MKWKESDSTQTLKRFTLNIWVSKLEDMIKGNVKIDHFSKLEKKMTSKEDLKGMARKEDLQDLKELIKDIKNSFIPHVSTQERDKEEKMTYSSHAWRKLKYN